jgi:hypothetical protein
MNLIVAVDSQNERKTTPNQMNSLSLGEIKQLQQDFYAGEPVVKTKNETRVNGCPVVSRNSGVH